MFVDASVLVAILLEEGDAAELSARIEKERAKADVAHIDLRGRTGLESCPLEKCE